MGRHPRTETWLSSALLLPRFLTNGGTPFAKLPAPLARDADLGVLDQLRGEAFLASPLAQIVLTSDGAVLWHWSTGRLSFGRRRT